MIFLGGNFFSGDTMSAPLTPTNLDSITNLSVYDGRFDDVYVTNETDYELTPEIEKTWTYDTVFWAKYNEHANAGNVDWTTDEVSKLLVKRKRSDEFEWITIKVVDITEEDDFNFYDTDYTAKAQTSYDYAVVPIKDNYEDFYNITTVDVKTKALIICDYQQVWYTHLSYQFLDTTTSVPSAVVTTLYNRYPSIIRNTSAVYDSVSVEAEFLPFENCKYTFEGIDTVAYRRKFKEFLCNGNPKILKSEDSRMWLCQLSSDINDNANQIYFNRKLSFSMTEIGNYENEEDLYNAKFIDVDSSYWNSVE